MKRRPESLIETRHCHRHHGVIFRAMRTTLALGDDLLAEAEALTGLGEKTALVREALKELIERESARWVARLGGSDPKAKAPPRRRPG